MWQLTRRVQEARGHTSVFLSILDKDLKKKKKKRTSHYGSAEVSLTSIHEDAGLILWPHSVG